MISIHYYYNYLCYLETHTYTHTIIVQHGRDNIIFHWVFEAAWSVDCSSTDTKKMLDGGREKAGPFHEEDRRGTS